MNELYTYYVFLIVLVGTLLVTACAPMNPPQLPASASNPRTVSLGESTLATPQQPNDRSTLHFSTSGWQTDFTKHSVPLTEISSGGPPRDGIPPIDHPKFESVHQADGWLNPQEPIIHLVIGNQARAYPLQILIWHEIVNDEVNGEPVVVTFCPLCNTAIAFERRLDGRTLDFGTTGNLRHSDLVMWDRQTESWWQQVTGEAIIGELTGKRLTMRPATIVSWAEFRQHFPQGRVLSRDTGYERSYGSNPYVGYDRVGQAPFLFKGVSDRRLPPMERVATVSLGGEDVAYPFTLLRERRVISDLVGSTPIVIFFQPGTNSALDAAQLSNSRDVGATGVYLPEVDGRSLSFTWQQEAFVDHETGSRWSVLGRATSGPLAGKQLEPVVHGNHFWFAWSVFKPATRIVQ